MSSSTQQQDFKDEPSENLYQYTHNLVTSSLPARRADLKNELDKNDKLNAYNKAFESTLNIIMNHLDPKKSISNLKNIEKNMLIKASDISKAITAKRKLFLTEEKKPAAVKSPISFYGIAQLSAQRDLCSTLTQDEKITELKNLDQQEKALQAFIKKIAALFSKLPDPNTMPSLPDPKVINMQEWEVQFLTLMCETIAPEDLSEKKLEIYVFNTFIDQYVAMFEQIKLTVSQFKNEKVSEIPVEHRVGLDLVIKKIETRADAALQLLNILKSDIYDKTHRPLLPGYETSAI